MTFLVFYIILVSLSISNPQNQENHLKSLNLGMINDENAKHGTSSRLSALKSPNQRVILHWWGQWEVSSSLVLPNKKLLSLELMDFNHKLEEGMLNLHMQIGKNCENSHVLGITHECLYTFIYQLSHIGKNTKLRVRRTSLYCW